MSYRDSTLFSRCRGTFTTTPTTTAAPSVNTTFLISSSVGGRVRACPTAGLASVHAHRNADCHQHRLPACLPASCCPHKGSARAAGGRINTSAVNNSLASTEASAAITRGLPERERPSSRLSSVADHHENPSAAARGAARHGSSAGEALTGGNIDKPYDTLGLGDAAAAMRKVKGSSRLRMKLQTRSGRRRRYQKPEAGIDSGVREGLQGARRGVK